MKRFLMIALFLVVNTFTATAQTSPNDVRPLVYVTEPINSQSDFRNFDLYVMNPQTGDIIFKSTTPERECPLRTSPDGAWLLYTQTVIENEDIKPTYRLVNFDTSAQYQIDLSEIESRISNAVWAANAESIYFFAYKQGDNRIYEYNLKTNTTTEVAHSESFIHLMQLGTEVVYWSTDDKAKELTINYLDGKTFTMRYSDSFLMGKPSPDGQYIVDNLAGIQLQDNDTPIVDLLDFSLIRLNDSASIPISDAYKRVSPAWRPDSQAIFYYDLDNNFVVYDIVRQQKMLFHKPKNMMTLDDESIYGYWSPDGRYVLSLIDYGYVSHHSQIELRVIDTSTGNITLISSYDDYEYRAGFIQWIDDHQFVYLSGTPSYDSDHSEKSPGNIFRFDATTGVRTQLTDTPDLIEGKECRSSIG